MARRTTATARLVTEWDSPTCTCAEHRDERVNERRSWAVVCDVVPIEECGHLAVGYPSRAAAIAAAREHSHDEAVPDA